MVTRSKLLLWGVVILIFFTGCSTKEVALKPEYSRYYDQKSNTVSDRILVNKIIDERKDKDSLGRIGRSIVSAPDITTWLHNGLKAKGFKFNARKIALDNQLILMDVCLKLAYIKQFPTVKSTQVVLKVTPDSDPSEPLYFRGRDTAILWADSTDEIQFSFDRALSQAIDAMIQKLESNYGNL